MDHSKLWPLNQLLEWIDRSNSKFFLAKGNELILLLAIAKFCNSEWKAFPSISRLANLCGKDRKYVEDLLKRMVAKGILSVVIRYKKDGGRDSNEYTINTNNLWGVGANSPLPPGLIYPHPRGRSTPLTIQLTNHVTKKKVAYAKNEQKKNQNPSPTVQPREGKFVPAKTAKKASDHLEEFMKKGNIH